MPERTPTMPVETSISVNAFGNYVVTLAFGHSLSESDPRPEYSLQHRWASLRKRARQALVARMAQDLRTTSETPQQALARIRASLPPLVVVSQDVDANNRWHGVSFAEKG